MLKPNMNIIKMRPKKGSQEKDEEAAVPDKGSVTQRGSAVNTKIIGDELISPMQRELLKSEEQTIPKSKTSQNLHDLKPRKGYKRIPLSQIKSMKYAQSSRGLASESAEQQTSGGQTG